MDSSFPWATLVVNAMACIILGYLSGVAGKSGLSDSVRYGLMTGFCGGFSTFSTFSAETFKLFETQPLYAIMNILGSVLLCLFCIYLGLKCAR